MANGAGPTAAMRPYHSWVLQLLLGFPHDDGDAQIAVPWLPRRARANRTPTDSYGLMEAISSPTCTFPDSSSSTLFSSLELVTMSMT